jgi:myxalamid-type polyketide synthase MxaE and MxaD
MSDPRDRRPLSGKEPIAIVGIGCRFPGASDPRSFWSLLINEIDAVGEIPADRFPPETRFEPGAAVPGRIATRRGGFLQGHELFDADFFGIAPREAVYLDPQQRLLLELTWEALEDAGLPTGGLVGSQTGVFVGSWLNDFEARICRTPEELDVHSVTGSGRYTISGRISFALGLEGPSLTIDTACSSGLAAVHLACQSLWTGESTLALAAAANIILEPHISIAYSQAGMLAADGRCKFGDASADGYVRSEGAAVVVLKPLHAAEADGDPIYAVIRGSAVNNNGRSGGFLVRPSQRGHEQMLRQAYRSAGVSPGDVQYIEAHGTGTRTGDPIELRALGGVLGEGRPADRLCLVGSVKTNIGHTEATAGIAGLIKTALSLKHGVIPASLHVGELNPEIPWSTLPLTIARERQTWRDGAPPIAGVSAFGIAGTNAHVVLQALPQTSSSRNGNRPHSSSRARILTISGRSEESLTALAGSYRDLLRDDARAFDIDDLCAWAALRRDHHSHRLAVVGSDRASLAKHLDTVLDGGADPLVARGRAGVYTAPRVAFVFPGQGGQWLGMAKQLVAEEPAFRATLDECDAAIRELTGWSVIEELHVDAASARLDRIDVVQPTIFAVQVSLAALWRSWGIEPAAVVGHSMGEIAAAAVAGVLSIRDAARIICRRSALMRRLSGAGAMGVVGLSYAETTEALRGHEDLLSVAASNSLKSTVVSGDPAALDALFATLESREVFCRRVKVDVASHSPQMDGIAPELLEALQGIQPRPATIPMYSTVLGRVVDGTECNPAYWMANLRHPVLFASSVQQMFADGVSAVLEISPHPVLESALTEAAHAYAPAAPVVVSTRREQDERETMLAALATLYVAGCLPEWSRFMVPGEPVSIPTYAWNRQRFWPAAPSETSRANSRSTGRGDSRIESSLHPGTFLWPPERSSSQDGVRYLTHLAVKTAREIAEGSPFILTSFDCKAGAFADTDTQRAAVLTGERQWTVTISARSSVGWTVICSAVLRVLDDSATRAGGISKADGPVERQIADGADALDAVIDLLEAEAGRLFGARCRVTALGSVSMAPSRVVSVRYVPVLTREGLFATVELRDEMAIVTGIVEGAVIEPVALSTDSGVHELVWESATRQPTVVEAATRDAVLVVAEQGTATCALLDRLRMSGEAVVSVSLASNDSPQPEWAGIESAVEQWLAAGGAPVGRVVFVDDGANAPRAGARTPTDAVESAMKLASVLRWLAHTGRSASTRMWVVTANAWPVTAGASCDVAAAATWGLARAAVREYPELICSTVDVDLEADSRAVDALADLVRARSQAVELAIRADRTFVPRIRPVDGSPADVAIRPDATYALTGGLGGMALEIAGWLVERGARHIALIGRRDPDASGRTAIAKLEAGGATVKTFRADVSSPDAVAALVSAMDKSMPPVAGLVHAAAVLSDELIADCRSDSMRSVLAAKADGAWHLHSLTLHWPLDFFAFCSSVAASVTQPGQASYAAANLVLDAIAAHRRANGRPAISMQWGLWAGTGLARHQGTMRSFDDWARQGLGAMTARTGLAAFERALGSPVATVIASPIDWARFSETRTGDDARGLFSRVIVRPRCDAESAAVASGPERLAAMSRDERAAHVRACLREQLAQVLRSDVARIDPNRPLGTIGLDSLLAVEFARRISAAVGLRLPSTAVFSFPTLAALESEIAARLEPASPEVEEVATPRSSDVTSDAPGVDTMSDEDAVLALMNELGGGR